MYALFYIHATRQTKFEEKGKKLAKHTWIISLEHARQTPFRQHQIFMF